MWFWQWNVIVSDIPKGRKKLVRKACEKFLLFDPDELDDPALYRAEGKDALPNICEPDQLAVEIRDIIWKAAGKRTHIYFSMASYDSCDDDGHSLDGVPTREYRYYPEHPAPAS